MASLQVKGYGAVNSSNCEEILSNMDDRHGEDKADVHNEVVRAAQVIM